MNYEALEKTMNHRSERYEALAAWNEKHGTSYRFFLECICAEYRSGTTPRELAAAFGMTRSGIEFQLKKTGTARRQRGGRNYMKLTPDDVRMIRVSNEPRRVLINRYGVHKDTILSIRNRKTWKDII